MPMQACCVVMSDNRVNLSMAFPIIVPIVFHEWRLSSSTPETSPKNVGLKLREALKQQVAIIHERLEAKKLAKLALAEVRELLAKEEEEKELELGRKEMLAKVKERVATRLKEEEDKLEREEMEKALEKRRKEKAKELDKKEEIGRAHV